jgi:nicotinamide mononucleotide (NMN) deamidase PncC
MKRGDDRVSGGRYVKREGKTLSTAESCTGGKIAAVLTSIPGASEYFKGVSFRMLRRLK